MSDLRAYGAVVRAAGFTLVELMVAMTISLMVVLVMSNVYVSLSRTNDEMAKTNGLIENGRSAIQIIENDLVHAGYWNGFVPQFDDLTATAVPGDVPAAIPDACLPVANWSSNDKSGLIGIAVQSTDVLPSGAGCQSFPPKRAGTDALVVRHAETCLPGGTNCDPDIAGRVYFQTSLCEAEKNAGTVQSATSNSVVLASTTSTANDAYTGVTLRIVSGTGMGQLRNISGYVGNSHTATVGSPWTTIPDSTSVYAFEYTFGSATFPLHRRDCIGTGSPATLPLTAGTIADKRRLISNIYYIANLAHPDRPDEVVPTLMRSQFDLASGTPLQLAPVRLLDGIEALRIEVGIDDTGKTGAPVDYTDAVEWVDTTTKTQTTNRGDGSPDSFKRCSAATPCTAAELTNVVAVKIYVLARNRDTTPGYNDTKSYCLGEPDADGTCPPTSTIAAANDSYKRHVFMRSVRLVNVSGRRETPES